MILIALLFLWMCLHTMFTQYFKEQIQGVVDTSSGIIDYLAVDSEQNKKLKEFLERQLNFIRPYKAVSYFLLFFFSLLIIHSFEQKNIVINSEGELTYEVVSYWGFKEKYIPLKQKEGRWVVDHNRD